MTRCAVRVQIFAADRPGDNIFRRFLFVSLTSHGIGILYFSTVYRVFILRANRIYRSYLVVGQNIRFASTRYLESDSLTRIISLSPRSLRKTESTLKF